MESRPESSMGPCERGALGVVIVVWFAAFASLGQPVGTTLWAASAVEGGLDGSGASWFRLGLSFALFVPLAVVTAQVVRRAPGIFTATLATLPAPALFVLILAAVDAARCLANDAGFGVQLAFLTALVGPFWASVVSSPFGFAMACALRWAKRRDEARATDAARLTPVGDTRAAR